MKATRRYLRTPKACAKRSTRVRRFCTKCFGSAVCLHVAFLATGFILFFLLIRRFRAGGLWLYCLRDQKFLSDLQLPWIVNVIERDQIVVRDFQFLCDSDWIIALLHDVSLSGRRRSLRLFVFRR